MLTRWGAKEGAARRTKAAPCSALALDGGRWMVKRASHWTSAARNGQRRARGVETVGVQAGRPTGWRSNHAQSLGAMPGAEISIEFAPGLMGGRHSRAEEESAHKLADLPLHRMLSFNTAEELDQVREAPKPAAPRTLAEEHAAFLGMYDDLAADVAADVAQLGLPPQSLQWIDEMFDYTIRGGKMARGLMVPQVVKGMGSASDQLMHQARVVGWCIEVLQAAFLVVDDVLDQADMRRGKAAYYRLPHVGMTAINDGLLLESLAFRLMRQHVRTHPSYLELTELFRESVFVTECGQLVDLTAPPTTVGHIEERFTMEQYRKMVQCKTSHYTFYLPVAAGLHLADAATDEALLEARTVCDAIGEYFQVQDDFLDCYGDAKQTGKGNTDIAERKCTWLAVKALELCADDEVTKLHLQKSLLAADTDRVAEIYEQLGVRDAYSAYEEASVAAIRARIGSCAGLAPARPLLEAVVRKLYKRLK